MSWLSKVGTILEKVLPFVLGTGSLFQSLGLPGANSAVATKVLGDLNSIPQLVTMAELLYPAVAGAKTGPAKLAAVGPLVAQLITQYAKANLPGSPTLKNPAALATAANQITSGFANAFNAFE
jgi:hypothetical protein